MKILIVGGGSGGHVTPAVAVAREILKLRPRAEIEFWTDRKYWANVEKITTLGEDEGQLKMKVRKIVSGKFRRYSGWKMADYFKLWRVTLVDLVLKNIGNGFLFLFGLGQSCVRLLKHKNRPDAIFLKGGYVGLPVGIVAGWLGIPYVIHESDVVAGLANRMLMKKAKVVATGFSGVGDGSDKTEGSTESLSDRRGSGETEGKYRFVGIPVGDEFKRVSEAEEKKLKRELGFSPEEKLVVLTGGSQGSERINQATLAVLPKLLESVQVGIVVGRKHNEKLEEFRKFEVFEEGKLKGGFRVWEFNSNMKGLLGAADIVVSRAGATTVAELSALEKAVILVPFRDLPNSHQAKNAERLEKAGAVKVLDDEKMSERPELLEEAILAIARRPAERKKLAEKLHEEIFKGGKGAAEKLAEIVVEVGEGK